MTNSNSVKITQPPVPPYDYLSPEYSTCEYGNHRDGTYIKNVLAQMLGGAKTALDDFHYRYIWFALDQVIKEACQADQLYNSFKLDNWSDGKPVAAITNTWPTHSRLLTDLAASYSAVE